MEVCEKGVVVGWAVPCSVDEDYGGLGFLYERWR